MVLKLGRFGHQIRNTCKVLKCGAGEGWRWSVGPIMWEMKKCYLRVNWQRNILHEIRKRKANWIGHILRRNCLLKQVIEGKIKGEKEVTRRRRKLLDDLKDRRGYSHLKEEVLDRTMWRNRFGGGFAPVVREWSNSQVGDQFGFRRGKGTRDAIGMLRILSERTLEIYEELCLLHRLAEGVWPSQLDQINADPKGNWYWLAGKKID